MTSNEAIRKKLKKFIPGGCHTYTKGDDQWPENAPAALERGKGCLVWDVEGNRFVDWSMGLASVSFGHANEEINKAAIDAMKLGQNFQRPSVMEAEAAERFLTFLGDRGEMVKFAKNGSTVTTAAVKLARAFTGRSKVVVCGDHPFFSYDDWFIGSTKCSSGIPEAIQKLTLKFRYNDIDSLHVLFKTYPGEISCVIMETLKFEKPRDGFLQEIKSLCHSNGALLILDEMITGFKWHERGASTYYQADADLYTWGKGIANGHSVCALTGRADIMSLGGLEHDKPRVFLSSTTHGAEIPQLAVLIRVLDLLTDNPNLIRNNWENGRSIRNRLVEAFKRNSLDESMEFIGDDCFFALNFKQLKNHNSNTAKTFLMQELIKEGQLFQGMFYTTFAHDLETIEETISAWDRVLPRLRQFIGSADRSMLVGKAIRPVFRRYNSCECLSERDCAECQLKAIRSE